MSETTFLDARDELDRRRARVFGPRWPYLERFRGQVYRWLGDGYDTRGLTQLTTLLNRFCPMTGSAMRPGALISIVNDIVVNRREVVVELGAGASTLFLAKACKIVGAELLSFDHEAEWAAEVRAMLASIDCTIATVVIAPLRPLTLSLDGSGWYDLDTVRTAIGSRRVSTIVCDGPSAYFANSRYARHPAVPVLKPFLANRWSIFLDDIHRGPERDIARRWSQELGTPAKLERLRGSFAYFTNETFATGSTNYFLP